MAIRPIVFYSSLLVIVLVLFIVGYFTSRQTIEIDGCTASWTTFSRNVSSPDCPTNGTCMTVPYVEQHNAFVDVILCACGKTRNDALNKKIVRLYKDMTGIEADADNICGGATLVKWKYS